MYDDVSGNESEMVFERIEGIDIDVAFWAKNVIDQGGSVGEVVELLERATLALRKK